MARYKDYSYEQGKFLPVSFDRQILPGTFEYTLNHLIDHDVDLSVFDGQYQNDESRSNVPGTVSLCDGVGR